MSAEVLGADLLGEVKVEGLDEVLRESPLLQTTSGQRLTISSFYTRFESSLSIQNNHLAFRPSIEFSASSRILPQPGSSSATRPIGLLSKQGRLLCLKRSHYQS